MSAAIGNRPVAAGALLAALMPGCAREATPPGGPPDRLPPIVILSEPDTFSTVEPFRSPVTLRFSERISERPSAGTLDQSVVVSPASGEVRVSHGREGLAVRVPGGFEAGHVYRVTVLPVIQDMFGNALQEPFELFFSTGPDFTPNVVAGSVIDRLTGEPLRDARVDAAVAESDVVHTAVTDSAGIFALRYLPAGDFVVSAYLDRNRNAQADFTEPQGTRPALLNGDGEAADTAIVLEVALLARDTTSARLARVVVEDSISLSVSLDDYLDPERPLDDVRVVVTSDSADAPRPLAVLHPHEAETYRSALADSLAREQAARDSVARAQADSAARAEAPAGDTTTAADPGGTPALAEAEADPPPAPTAQEAGEAGEAAEERPAAQQNFIVILDGVLVPEMPYQVEVSNITNINGVGGGEGTVDFTRPAPPPPPEDTTQAATDSVPPDTIPAAAPGATPTPVDTAGRDTIPAAEAAPAEATPGDTPTVPADSTARDTIPPSSADSVGRDTIPSPAADSVRRDTVSAPPGDSVRRDTVAIPPTAALLRHGRRIIRMVPARNRFSRRPLRRTAR